MAPTFDKYGLIVERSQAIRFNNMIDQVMDVLSRLGLLGAIQVAAAIIIAVFIFKYFTSHS